MPLIPKTRAWATDCWCKSGVGHLYYVGERFSTALCGNRTAYTDDLQAKPGDYTRKCKKCLKYEANEPKG